MAGLYPSLQDKFTSENICPICMMEMAGTPKSKYSCENHHILCHRCKPYYHSCPTCRSPLSTEIPSAPIGEYHMPPAVHCMPHPYPPYPSGSEASAPFLDSERHRWRPPIPTVDQELHACQYAYLGCYVQIPEHLRSIHEDRCQFRLNLEENHLPTDLNVDEGALEDCRYRIAGCNVRLPIWRKLVHEKRCIYKDKLEELSGLSDQLEDLNVQDNYDPEELVECRFSKYGCQVRMPRRRKYIHEEKCHHGKHHEESDEEEEYIYIRETDEDPDEKLPCRWSEFGCQVEPRRCRKENHEEKCNYRREHCGFANYGCCQMLDPARKFAHERNCEYGS